MRTRERESAAHTLLITPDARTLQRLLPLDKQKQKQAEPVATLNQRTPKPLTPPDVGALPDDDACDDDGTNAGAAADTLCCGCLRADAAAAVAPGGTTPTGLRTPAVEGVLLGSSS